MYFINTILNNSAAVDEVMYHLTAERTHLSIFKTRVVFSERSAL